MKYFTESRQWWAELFLVGLVLFVGVALRTIQVDRYPVNNLDDGVYYVWAGASFWQNPFSPTSFTLFVEENPNLFWRSAYLDELPDMEFGFRMVEPWFDHPPLGAALIGLPAYLLGYTNYENVPYGIVRLMAVVASIFTLTFTYLLIRELFGRKLATITTVVLAATPYFVFAHRQSYLENILTPFFLLAVWQGYRAVNNKSTGGWAIVIPVIAAFLCGWIKLVGLVVPLLLALWSVRQRNQRLAIIFAITFALSLGSYILYGVIADQNAFIFTLFNQGVRGTQWGNLAQIFNNMRLAGPLFADTTLTLGWIATLIYTVGHSFFSKQAENDSSASYISWLFACWLLIVILTSGTLNSFIWYRYPLFPILSFGIAWLIHSLWQKQNLLGSSILALLGWSQLSVVAFDFTQNFDLRLLIVATVAIPFILFVISNILSLKKVWLSHALLIHRLWLVAILTLIITTNILVVLQFPRHNCAQAQCTLPTKIMVQIAE